MFVLIKNVYKGHRKVCLVPANVNTLDPRQQPSQYSQFRYYVCMNNYISKNIRTSATKFANNMSY